MWKIACAGLFFLGLLFGSCKNEDFKIGVYLPESHAKVGMIDTVTIKVSNMIAVDSVVTSNKAIGFSGIYTDPQIGTVQTQTYVEFSRTTDSENDRYAKFDSVTLVLRPNGNYYGDTVKYASFKVSKLINKIEKREDGYLYSTSRVPVGDQLTDTMLRIKVRQQKNFEITLPESFGEWLFQGILRNADAFTTDNYLKTFPGISISPGAGSNCMHGLAITDSTCMIRIYYHVSTTYKEDKIMTFKVNSANSFYHLDNDRAKFPAYNAKSDPVPSSQTDNKGIVMSGTPLYTRLEFPHLNELLSLGHIVKIQQATLYVRPVDHSYDTVPLPPQLHIYYFDPTSNTPLSSAIRPPGGDTNTGVQTGNLPENYQNILRPDFPQYTFDITDFISTQLGKVGYSKWALSLIIPDDSRETTLQRLVFGDQKYWYRNDSQSMDNRIKVEVVYVVYND
ncbi:MAG: DUF4270 domain-containing protein [Bacteroidales bacterium]|jgi:hypothetical protein|nr:DUF4270 domain-containing protein [Bacteroidales bacterium]